MINITKYVQQDSIYLQVFQVQYGAQDSTLRIEEGEWFQDATMRLPMCQVGPKKNTKLTWGRSTSLNVLKSVLKSFVLLDSIQGWESGNVQCVFGFGQDYCSKRTYISSGESYPYILHVLHILKTSALFWFVFSPMDSPNSTDSWQTSANLSPTPGSCCRSINFARIRLKIVRASSETWAKLAHGVTFFTKNPVLYEDGTIVSFLYPLS